MKYKKHLNKSLFIKLKNFTIFQKYDIINIGKKINREDLMSTIADTLKKLASIILANIPEDSSLTMKTYEKKTIKRTKYI